MNKCVWAFCFFFFLTNYDVNGSSNMISMNEQEIGEDKRLVYRTLFIRLWILSRNYELISPDAWFGVHLILIGIGVCSTVFWGGRGRISPNHNSTKHWTTIINSFIIINQKPETTHTHTKLINLRIFQLITLHNNNRLILIFVYSDTQANMQPRTHKHLNSKRHKNHKYTIFLLISSSHARWMN